jgi:vacuolar-type H+-ATPase subunit C/Vma6
VSSFSYADAQAFIRARLSNRLDQAAWSRLLDCKTPHDLAQALGQTPAAIAVGPNVGPNGQNGDGKIGEGEIRLQMLRADDAATAQSLVRYLPRNARNLVSWYNRRFEIENLKTVLRSVHYDLDPRRAARVLIPLRSQMETGHGRWDVLLTAGSIPAVMERLRGSPYAAPLEQASERYRQEQRLFHLEVSLDLFYYRRLVQLIEVLKGSEATQAMLFLGRWIALRILSGRIDIGSTAE